jgi:AcrR family transcriptional regulator
VGKEIQEGSEARNRILDAAEKLFADQGFEAVSLRQITTQAEVNLAAVNYYFGSKEGLIIEVLARVVGPINERRLAMLDEAEAEVSGKPVEIERILEAVFLPIISSMNESEHSRQVVLKLAGRCMSESGDEMPEAMLRIFREVADRFCGALFLALPHLSKAEVYWRMHFTIGSMLYALVQHETLVSISAGEVVANDAVKALEELVAFTAGGLRAENAVHEKEAQLLARSATKGGKA